MMDADVCLAVVSEDDVVAARQRGRALAEQVGMSASAQTMVATAISEISRNLVIYGGGGEMSLTIVADGARTGVQIVAADRGPGIADIDLAMSDGYSTGNSLGLGLPGARRLMDDFDLRSRPGEGTTVTMRKWLPES